MRSDRTPRGEERTLQPVTVTTMAEAERRDADRERTGRIVSICLGLLLLLVSAGLTAGVLFAERPAGNEPWPVAPYALLLVVMWTLSVGSLTSSTRRRWLRRLSRWSTSTGALGLAAFLVCIWAWPGAAGAGVEMDPALAALAGVALFVVAVGLALFIGERRAARRGDAARDSVFASPMSIAAWPVLLAFKSPLVFALTSVVVIGVSYVGALTGATRGAPLSGALVGAAVLLFVVASVGALARRRAGKARSAAHEDDDAARDR
jgi:hypothetical protein